MAYAVCRIENHDAEAIIDTGARGCIVNKNSSDEPTRMTITVANGVEATSLGKVKAVPVRFGEATIPISAIVANATS